MFPQARDVVTQGDGTVSVGLGCDISGVGCEADLAVDDHRPTVGVAYDDVRSQASTVLFGRDDGARLITEGLLHEVMLATDQATLVEDTL